MRFGQCPRVACSVAALELQRVVAFSRIVLTENFPIHNVLAAQIVVRQSNRDNVVSSILKEHLHLIPFVIILFVNIHTSFPRYSS